MKIFLFPFMSLLLILAISAAPIIPLLDKELGETMLVGAAEEEKSSKVFTIKKFDESDIYNKYLLEWGIHPFLQEHSLGFLRYIFPISDYTVEILDPPPRKLV
ncbi:MAG: hypothetical protein VX798_05730 [Bacteroidota bacterium]|uniref:Uncharacterized protein n=1 Tax=Flagellimonas profundi TaxID=2915620 RepID=A0ABS3FFU3_9FLAO|nr:hypothetical protein [Allomuricauda profundi]MBO0341933.1 hypothetical protein [Allomuricauda profundi]MEC7770664.1 hypothetical protein [Bacteroidota bacterium]